MLLLLLLLLLLIFLVFLLVLLLFVLFVVVLPAGSCVCVAFLFCVLTAYCFCGCVLVRRQLNPTLAAFDLSKCSEILKLMNPF